MSQQPDRSAVYRFYDADDVLLYVGMSGDPNRREINHRAKADWYPRATRRTVEWYPSRADAHRAEAAAIRDERPAFNNNMGEPRVNVVVRMSAEDIANLDAIASDEGISRSRAIRRLLSWSTKERTGRDVQF